MESITSSTSVSSQQKSVEEDLTNQITELQREVGQAQQKLRNVNTAKRKFGEFTNMEGYIKDKIKDFEQECLETETKNIRDALQAKLRTTNAELQTAQNDLAVVIETFTNSITATNNALDKAVETINGKVADGKPGCSANIPKFVDLLQDIIKERQKYLGDGTLAIAFEDAKIPGLGIKLTKSEQGTLTITTSEGMIGSTLQIPTRQGNNIQMINPLGVNQNKRQNPSVSRSESESESYPEDFSNDDLSGSQDKSSGN